MLAVLHQLADTGQEYNGFLANHGPMAADAMIRLGHGDRVEAWVELYRRDLGPPAEPGRAVTSESWREHLGQIARLGDWTSYFRTLIDDDGWATVLSQWWPRLLPGAAASATHGLIRTAHAVRNLADVDQSDNLLTDELASGLAYWAARYQPLPGHPTLTGRHSLGDAIDALPRLAPGVTSAGPGISGRLQSLFGLDGFPAALDAWGPAAAPATALDELISHAAHVVLVREDAPIAYCHAVTAPAAVRMILPSIPDDDHHTALAACWHIVAAIIAAHASAPHPAPVADVATVTPAPSDLAAAAVDHGDEHVIKLTEACLRQFDHTADLTLLAAADRFRDRVRPRW